MYTVNSQESSLSPLWEGVGYLGNLILAENKEQGWPASSHNAHSAHSSSLKLLSAGAAGVTCMHKSTFNFYYFSSTL